MPKFKVQTLDRRTAAETWIEVDADSVEDARARVAAESSALIGQVLAAPKAKAASNGHLATAAPPAHEPLGATGDVRGELMAMRMELAQIRSAGMLRSPVIRISVGVFLGLLMWAVFCILLWMVFAAVFVGLLAGAAGAAKGAQSGQPKITPMPPAVETRDAPTAASLPVAPQRGPRAEWQDWKWPAPSRGSTPQVLYDRFKDLCAHSVELQFDKESIRVMAAHSGAALDHPPEHVVFTPRQFGSSQLRRASIIFIAKGRRIECPPVSGYAAVPVKTMIELATDPGLVEFQVDGTNFTLTQAHKDEIKGLLASINPATHQQGMPVERRGN